MSASSHHLDLYVGRHRTRRTSSYGCVYGPVSPQGNYGFDRGLTAGELEEFVRGTALLRRGMVRLRNGCDPSELEGAIPAKWELQPLRYRELGSLLRRADLELFRTTR